MSAETDKLGKVIGVRLPQPIMDALEAESDRDHIAVATLVRRAVMRACASDGAKELSITANESSTAVKNPRRRRPRRSPGAETGEAASVAASVRNAPRTGSQRQKARGAA